LCSPTRSRRCRKLGPVLSEGWLDARGVVQIAVAKSTDGLGASEVEEQIALLLPDQLDQLSELLGTVDPDYSESQASTELWLFIALAWVVTGRGGFEDPQSVVDMLYADFGYADLRRAAS